LTRPFDFNESVDIGADTAVTATADNASPGIAKALKLHHFYPGALHEGEATTIICRKNNDNKRCQATTI